MNKKIILIQSHCDTEEKKNYLIDNISKLRKYDVDILLFSHIPLPNEITSLADYFVYDKSNPVLYEERRHYYWWGNDELLLETSVPDYGWAVFNQIIKSYDLIKRSEYEYVYVFCYDVIIDETIDHYLKNPETSIFIHLKGEDVDGKGDLSPVRFDTGLVFLVMKNEEMKILIDSISKEEYVKRTDLIAEAYLETKLKENNMYHRSERIVNDFFDQGNDIFNLTKNKPYCLFVDNVDLLKFRVIKKSGEMSVVVNNKITLVDSDYFIFSETLDDLKIFGCFFGGIFDNWIPYITETRVNKITIR